MSFKLFIHHNVVETIEQMCIAAKELKPDDPLIQSEDFKLVEPEITSAGDQFRSNIQLPNNIYYTSIPIVLSF